MLTGAANHEAFRHCVRFSGDEGWSSAGNEKTRHANRGHRQLASDPAAGPPGPPRVFPCRRHSSRTIRPLPVFPRRAAPAGRRCKDWVDHSGGILVEQEISDELAGIKHATGRLLGTIAGLTEAQARAPSLLPGWTRGHVLTHIARNADGLANLLRWARTGTQTPMYASSAARDADIEAGAGRPAAELAADVRESASAFADEAARVPADSWTVLVTRTPGGAGFPARQALLRRRSELEIHHVDLGAGYRPEDWPADFVAEAL
ncbi:MAG: maleylpyruvate isomerase N-terminal domain-containing protein, partial [Actinobacteria bacterium]|nr:maleylpyruvate isomerase N-terminal domain-containing protein [Actinomycetota bacterium]